MKINGSGLNATLLWDNPNKGSVFGGGWIDCSKDLNDFDFLLILFPLYAEISWKTKFWTILRLNDDQYFFNAVRTCFGVSHDEGVFRARRISWDKSNKNKIYIGAAYNNNGGVENDKVVPYQIYGIKSRIQGIN